MAFIFIFVIVQIIVAGIVIVVLNQKLKKELIEAALENLQANISSQTQGEIILISANEIDALLRARIENIIKRKLERPVVTYQIDPQIKSGLIIKIDTMVLDFSLANRLKSLSR